jgi:hypothetical protein
LLTVKRHKLDKLALALLKHETLTGTEIKKIIEENTAVLEDKPVNHPVIELNGSPVAPLA